MRTISHRREWSRTAAIAGLVLLSLLRPAEARQAPTDPARLLEGVEAIPPVGTVGQVAVWGDAAFAVVLGREGRTQAPIVGAGTLGRGRVMAWAHSYDSAAAAARLSTGRLLVNACRWASGPAGENRVRVALLDSDLAGYLTGQGLEAAKIEGGAALEQNLVGATVLLCGRADLTDREVETIDRFVQSGGGFVCFACAWGWAQVRRRPVSDIPFNRILAGAGIAFADGYAEPTRDGAFRADSLPGPEFNARAALDILTGESADAAVIRQAGATTTRAVAALPRDDQLLRPRLRALLAARGGELAPAPHRPLKESRTLDRVLLAVQLSELESLPAAEVPAHPAAADFPGAVPAGAAAVTRRVTVNAAPPRWRSTGLYAPAGRPITVTLLEGGGGGQGAGLRVRIGCHTDELWHHDQWRRVPRISHSWPLDAQRVTVASPVGGPVYIEVPKRSPARAEVEIEGAVEAPLFVLSETTLEEWTSRVRDLPGPWAELACDRVILSIPSDVARKIDDPAAIMEHWVRVLDACADLAAIPRERPWPQRYVADVQISAGYMHSGYPIMTHLDAAAFMTDRKGLVDSGWGLYHEMGHNHQDGMWTFDGTGEVTCNLFTLYVLETVCGVADASRQKVFGHDAVRSREKYLAGGRRFDDWKRDPFLALQMYAQLRLEFGWDAYRRVFAEYRALPPADRPRSDEQKRDQWLVRMSRSVGRNLGPFFEAWGVPTTPAARQSITDLPEWLPAELRAR